MPTRRRLVRIVLGVGIIGLAYYIIAHIALSILLRHLLALHVPDFKPYSS